MNVQCIVDALERIAPLRYAEPWDNVGLLIGSPSAKFSGPFLLTVDLTERILAEAVSLRCSGVIAYHPPIWDPLKRITDATNKERIVLKAIHAHLAVYSPHTALDAAPAGLTDWLCEGISGTQGRIAGDCRALVPANPPADQVKIVTFVPESAADGVRNALASAGAGHIGTYSLCSFAAPGTGTFLGAAGTSPAVGEAERLERVPEMRLEMICPRAATAIAIATLRRFHPYEAPAIDIIDLIPQPERAAGAGRRLVLDEPATLRVLAARLKQSLAIDHVEIAAPTQTGLDQPVTHVGVCAGSGGKLAATAHANGCEVFVTGEMDHHLTLAAVARGMAVILAGHTNTERGFLPRLAERLAAAVPEAKFLVSRVDASPTVVV